MFREKFSCNGAASHKKTFDKQEGAALLPSETKFSKFKRKAGKIARRTLRTVAVITVIGVAAAVINHRATHPNLKVTTNSDGTITYVHPDKQTTHLLNVFAGREKFSTEDILFFDRELKGRDSLLIDRAKELNASFFDTSYYIPNKKIYNLIWELEQECGNPKLRFYDQNSRLLDYFSLGRTAACYSFLENTIYFSPYIIAFYSARDAYYAPREDPFANHPFIFELFAEISHAKQSKNGQLSFYVKVIKETFKPMILKVRYLLAGLPSYSVSDIVEEEYDKRYDEPGTIEYEAHKIIQPYLEKKYPLFIKKQ